jgi:acyl-CoA synthetase (AMP-forming)/AMP-acid ligase II
MTDIITTDWTFANVFEAIAARAPDRPCQMQGDRVITWGQFDRRADALAADFVDAGLGHQAKVACYLYNGPEYMETMVAAFKASMVPVNTNYRYGPDEIIYLFDNADAEAVVFHACFTELLEGIRDRLPKVRRWYVVSDETGDGPSWASPYERVVTSGTALPALPWSRSGDDLLLLYTGGTTGMPKGVMWRNDDLFNVLGAGGSPLQGTLPGTSVDELAARIDPAQPQSAVMLVACPLMHGTGQFSALIAMTTGGAVVSLANRKFDVDEMFQTVQRLGVTNIVIVGQAFAGPMLDHLEEDPGRYDLSSVAVMSSSGVMWSQENKAGLLRHIPQMIIFDSYGSSEAVGLGGSVSGAGAAEQTAKFALGVSSAVFTDDGRRVEPGSGEQGMVAVGGYLPLGYYKDEAKTAQTFRTIEGRRWSVPGDFAEVNADGSLHLLGRGSVCINTGGEKVFPEEVEEALKTHPMVRDAVAVGLPDDRFGETICAVVEPEEGEHPTLSDLSDHVKHALAAYKAPRQLVLVDSIQRAPNGKVDYKRLKGLAVDRVAVAGDTTGH